MVFVEGWILRALVWLIDDSLSIWLQRNESDRIRCVHFRPRRRNVVLNTRRSRIHTTTCRIRDGVGRAGSKVMRKAPHFVPSRLTVVRDVPELHIRSNGHLECHEQLLVVLRVRSCVAIVECTRNCCAL